MFLSVVWVRTVETICVEELLNVWRRIVAMHFVGRSFSWITVEIRNGSNHRWRINSFAGGNPLLFFGTFRYAVPHSSCRRDAGSLFPIGWRSSCIGTPIRPIVTHYGWYISVPICTHEVWHDCISDTTFVYAVV